MTTTEVPFPFVRHLYGEDESWKPGTRCETAGEYDDEIWLADGMGHMLLTEHKRVAIPGFVDRVFYTRKWRDPYGNVFGKHTLRCISAPAFKRMLRGYRHKFECAA